MSEGICYIFGAGDFTHCDIIPTKKDLVIAADGGYDYASGLGIHVDILIGDFDSISDVDLPENRIVYPSEKDDTDMMLVIKYGLDKGYRTFEIYGGLGGRMDHSIANLQALQFLCQHGAVGTLHSENYRIKAIQNSSLTFPAKEDGLVSVFSLSNESLGVTLKNLKYPLNDYTLTNFDPIGTSNRFIGLPATITVKKGTIAIVWYL